MEDRQMATSISWPSMWHWVMTFTLRPHTMSLSYTAYRKPIHINLYFTVKSHNDPNKQFVLSTLLYMAKARTVSMLNWTEHFMKTVTAQNIYWGLNSHQQQGRTPFSVAFLSIQNTFNHISRVCLSISQWYIFQQEKSSASIDPRRMILVESKCLLQVCEDVHWMNQLFHSGQG
jgi:hypothetical protein